MQGDLAKAANDTPSKPATPRLWSCLWRGAIGGALGTLVVLSYAIYRDPYALLAGSGLLILVLLGSADGSFIGVMIWFSSRLIRRRLAWGFRIVLGTTVTAALIASYLYLQEGIGDTPGWFILDSVLFGLVVGGSAGAMSHERQKKSEALA